MLFEKIILFLRCDLLLEFTLLGAISVMDGSDVMFDVASVTEDFVTNGARTVRHWV